MKFLTRNLHQSYFVVAFCLGIIAGAALALIFRIKYFGSPFWVVFALLVLFFTFLKLKLGFVLLAFLAGMILMFYRAAEELRGEEYIKQSVGQNVVVMGTVDGDPETDEAGTKYKIREHKTGGSLYISGYKNYKLARADEVTLEGKMSDGFGTYAGYMYKPTIKNLRRPEPGDFVLKIRNWFAERVKSLIPEPQSKLGLAYLVGMKSGLPDELSENLRIVGLTHIVVASGAHLSILVEIARKIFGKLSRFAALLFSVLFVIFFMAMVGWTPSILRAGTMSILTLITWYVGRKIAPLRIIIMVMAMTLMMNPMFLINIGWLLSFASYAGIMLLGPELKKIFYGDKKPGFIAEMVIVTLAATLMTLPITLYFFGAVSLISVIANLLILPTLSYAMGLVFLAGVVAGLPGVDMVVSFVATKLLDYHILVVDFFGKMKQFLVEMPTGQLWVFAIYVIIVALFLYVWWKKSKRKNKYVIMRP